MKLGNKTAAVTMSFVLPVFFIMCHLWLPAQNIQKYAVSGSVYFNGVKSGKNKVRIKGQSSSFSEEQYSENGDFRFEVPNGIYLLSVENSMGLVSQRFMYEVMIDSYDLNNYAIHLEEGCIISGFVKKDNNIPIKNAFVVVKSLRGMSHTNTDAKGHYKIAGLRAGKNIKVHLIVKDIKSRPERTVSLSEGEIISGLNFTIRTGGTISGKVVADGSGKPLKGAMVMLQKGGKRIAMTSTDKKGIFIFSNLEGSEAIELDVWHYGYVNPQGVIQVVPGSSDNLIVNLRKE